MDRIEEQKKTTDKRKKNDQEAVLKRLSQISVVQFACTLAGISRATFYRWKKEDPDFAEAAETAMKEGKLFICDLAESKVIEKIKEGNFPAARYYLEHHSEDYKKKERVRYISPKSLAKSLYPSPEKQKKIDALLDNE